jgi:hypothetical protein
MEPRYVARAGGIRQAPAVLAALTAILLGVGVLTLVLLPDAAGIWVLLLSLAPVAAMLWLILPRRYEVWPDSLRIVFPLWRWRIGFDTLERAEPAKAWQPYGFWGLRFVTSPGQAVTVYRKHSRLLGRPNLVISPDSRDEFLAQLHAVLSDYH